MEMKERIEAIADCPFCGSPPAIERSANWAGVYCSNAGCFMHYPEQPNIAAWNARAPKPTDAEMVEVMLPAFNQHINLRDNDSKWPDIIGIRDGLKAALQKLREKGMI